MGRLTERIAISLMAAVLGAPAGHAYMSETALNAKLTAAKVLPRGTTIRVIRDQTHLRIEVGHYPTLDQRTQKIDALLIARTVMHADPGGVDSLVTRFVHDSEPYGYRDAVVSNRDIVGADAGIMGTEELLSGIELVVIRANDSVEQRFTKYCQAAEHELSQDDFREAENLFAEAYRQSPDSARNDGRYLTGMVRLAKAYSGREDPKDEERVFQLVLKSLPTVSSPDALHAVRDVYDHFYRKDDYGSAEIAAKALVSLHGGAAGQHSAQYADDLELLARCHRKQGRVVDAKKEYEEALLLKRNTLGENHPSLAEVFEGIGDCYADEKNMPSAHEFWKQAKVAYDHAVVSKDTKHRISYEVYRSIVARLNTKLGKGPKP